MKLAVTRTYRFAAAHCLASPALSAEQNAALYGKCSHAGGHGHNYRLEVRVGGRPDPETGLLRAACGLDRLVRERVLDAYAATRLDREVEDFRQQVATAENICRAAWQRLAPCFASGVLEEVSLWETRKNLFRFSEQPAQEGDA